MFRETEGLSTLEIAQGLQQHPQPWQFTSIDYDPEHVAWAEAYFRRHAAGLGRRIQWRCGDSQLVLPEVLAGVEQLDFAYLDGGAHAEICLVEFERVLAKLSPEGLILVDDLQPLAPSEKYPVPRVFGKATLILPFLVIAEYLREKTHTVDLPAPEHRSDLLACVQADRLLASLASWRFQLLQLGSHRMLAVAGPDTLARFAAA